MACPKTYVVDAAMVGLFERNHDDGHHYRNVDSHGADGPAIRFFLRNARLCYNRICGVGKSSILALPIFRIRDAFAVPVFAAKTDVTIPCTGVRHRAFTNENSTCRAL